MRRRWWPWVFLLALSGLLGCEEKIKPAVLPDIDSRSLPQQESWNSSIALSDSGRLRAIVYATYIRKYEQPREILLSDGITVHFFAERESIPDGRGRTGRTSILTAREGKVDEMTNNLEASGHVVVVSDDSTRLETERLFWDNKRERIHTPEYVSIVSPRERVHGHGFESDQHLRNYRIFRVTGEARAD